MLIEPHYVTLSADWGNPPELRQSYVEYLPDPYQQIIDSMVRRWDEDWFSKKPNHDVSSEPTLQERFLEQAEKWEQETGHLSSPNKRISHPSYQAILGMGRDVVPLLLKDMAENQRAWFAALSYLTQENPIRREDIGRMDKMIDAWTAWGRFRGIF